MSFIFVGFAVISSIKISSFKSHFVWEHSISFWLLQMLEFLEEDHVIAEYSVCQGFKYESKKRYLEKLYCCLFLVGVTGRDEDLINMGILVWFCFHIKRNSGVWLQIMNIDIRGERLCDQGRQHLTSLQPTLSELMAK